MSAHTLASISSLVAGTSNAPGGFTNGSVIDLGAPSAATAPDGGTLYLKLTNGATGPIKAAELVVFESVAIGNTAPALPTTPAGDANWKQVHAIGSGTAANDETTGRYTFGPGVRYLLAMIRGNTGQAVVGEALGQSFAY